MKNYSNNYVKILVRMRALCEAEQWGLEQGPSTVCDAAFAVARPDLWLAEISEPPEYPQRIM
jgi:hypothetical protein